jgi:hypothetical protein
MILPHGRLAPGPNMGTRVTVPLGSSDARQPAGWQIVVTSREPSAAVQFLQCGRDVIAEGGRHLGSGGDDPGEPGHRGDRH